MKNKLSDLNNHLFAQLERLGDESTTGKALESEIHRANSIASVAKQVIGNASLALKAQKLLHENLIPAVPEMLELTAQK